MKRSISFRPTLLALVLTGRKFPPAHSAILKNAPHRPATEYTLLFPNDKKTLSRRIGRGFGTNADQNHSAYGDAQNHSSLVVMK